MRLRVMLILHVESYKTMGGDEHRVHAFPVFTGRNDG